LKANYGFLPLKDISIKLNRKANAIKKKAARLGLVRKNTIWTNELVEQVAELYPLLGPIELAKRMSLSREAVYNKAHKLGLKMTPENRGKISSRINTSRPMTEHTKKMISKANRKYDEPNRCIECGHPVVRRAIRCQPCELKRRKGPNHNWWKGGTSSLNDEISRLLYPIWKYPIMCRDHFICQGCNSSINLEVHHLVLYTEIRDRVLQENPTLSVAKYEDRKKLAKLIVAEHKMEDGITLCRPCHESCHFGKPDELLGPLTVKDEANQQPSLSKVISIVDRKVQRAVGEEITANNPTTSVRVVTSNDDMMCSELHRNMQK